MTAATATRTTATAVVTAATAVAIADQLNAGFAAGRIATVNGRELVSRHGAPVARSWANGSVSVTVKGRTKGKVADLYVKVGETLRTA